MTFRRCDDASQDCICLTIEVSKPLYERLRNTHKLENGCAHSCDIAAKMLSKGYEEMVKAKGVDDSYAGQNSFWLPCHAMDICVPAALFPKLNALFGQHWFKEFVASKSKEHEKIKKTEHIHIGPVMAALTIGALAQ